MSSTKLTGKTKYLVASLFLSTGAALVIYVLSGISLLFTFILLLCVASGLIGVIWQRLSVPGRARLKLVLKVGLISGIIATAAYDVVRLFLIEITGIEFWPFDIFNVFGQALVGPSYSGPAVRGLGLIYHFANGIGFAIAYVIIWGKRGIWAGIGWAFVLEIFMVSIYPGWLDIRAINEFLQVSIFGHMVYGAVLGYTAKWLLQHYEARGTLD